MQEVWSRTHCGSSWLILGQVTYVLCVLVALPVIMGNVERIT